MYLNDGLIDSDLIVLKENGECLNKVYYGFESESMNALG